MSMPPWFATVFVGIAVVGMMVFLNRKMRKKQAVAFDQWRVRLQNPRWQIYETYLQRPVPQSLKRTYQRLAGFLSENELELVDQHGKFITLTEFFAIDETAQDEQKPHQISQEDVFPFGTCAGVDLFLRAGASQSDAVWTYLRAEAEFVALFNHVDDFEQVVLRALSN
jgi:hypothetical protein